MQNINPMAYPHVRAGWHSWWEGGQSCVTQKPTEEAPQVLSLPPCLKSTPGLGAEGCLHPGIGVQEKCI